jgi:hypothetical protein
VLVEHTGDYVLLERAEVSFALVDEDVLDARAGRGLDVGVGVTRRDAEPRGELLGHGGLAGARRPDDDNDRLHWCLRFAR